MPRIKLRTPPPMHSPKTCSISILRSWFYACVRSPFKSISIPARAILKWRVEKIEERMRAGKHYGAEQKLAARYCKGKGIDVGCGSKKTTPGCIGVDVTPKGKYGFAGSQLFEKSQADVVASGDDLPFKDGELDYVIARHNLEHYQDPVKTIQEWHRVLKTGGTMVLIMPDDEFLHTASLDPTHYHVYTRDSLARLITVIGGFRIVRKGDAIPKWSFIIVAKKR